MTSGPSVRGILAAGELYVAVDAVDAVDAVAGGPPEPHGARLLRAALLCLPHRLRVRAGTDAEQIVRDAVFAVAMPAGGDLGPPEVAAEPEDEDKLRRDSRPVFRLGDAAEEGSGSRGRVALPGPEPEIAALLVDVLRPVRRGPLADGATASIARPPVGERGAPTPMRPGDPARDLSVRASLRAALRVAAPDATQFSGDWLRVRRPRPDVGLDIVLTLDISASMAGAEVAPLARAITGGIVRSGHRVALQAFAVSVTTLCGLTRDPARLLAAAGHYEPADPTNLEHAIVAAHDLLARTGSPGRGPGHPPGDRRRTDRLVATAAARPRVRRRAGPAVALDAGRGAQGIAVSVLCPPPAMVGRVDPGFAAAWLPPRRHRPHLPHLGLLQGHW